MVRIIPLLCILGFCISSRQLSAQGDSSIYQFWGRDPNTDIENTVSNQKQIITKHQILSSGYSLVSDLFQLIDGWTQSTWNGDKWNMQSNGTGNYQTQNWTLLLNGQRIELMKLDAQHINTIGITVYDIERIEIVNAVGNYLGEFNEKGIIHIITKQNKDGITYRGLIGNGNEIGDPHLNIFNVKSSNANVDEYGASFGNHLGFKKGKWNVQFNQYYNNYFYRDTLLFPYVYNTNPNADVVQILRSGRIQATYLSTKMMHQFAAITSRYTDVVIPASIFNPIIGKQNYNMVGYTMRYEYQKGVLQYKGSFMSRSFAGDDQKFISHNQQSLTNNLNYTIQTRNFKGNIIRQFGIAYDFFSTQIVSTKNTDVVHLLRPYFSYTYPTTKKSNVFADISITTNTANLLPKLALGYYKQPTIITNWSVIASFSQRSQAENNSYLYFFSMLDSNSFSLSEQVTTLATADYFFNLNVNRFFKVSFNSGLKILQNEFLFRPTPFFYPTYPQLAFTEIDGIQQTRWVNRINVHYSMLTNIKFDINYIRIATINNDAPNPISRHRLSLNITYNLPSRFDLWMRYYYQSQSFWINPLLINQQNNVVPQNLYSEQVPVHTFDLGVTKKLLKDFLTTNISVRNILNAQERYQPNGAVFNLRLFLSLRMDINDVFAKTVTKP